IYCFEAADHGGFARNLVLRDWAALESTWRADLLGPSGGAMTITARGEAVRASDALHKITEERALLAVPYAFWDNRAGGEMAVWIAEDESHADYPGLGARLEQGGVVLAASHCWKSDTLAALTDGKLPASSADESIPRLTFWDHQGTREWVEMTFREP